VFSVAFACHSAPDQSLFGNGQNVGNPTGGSSFLGAGGAGGSTLGSGGFSNPSSGGIPNSGTGGILGAGGMPGSGGFNLGGSPLDGSSSTGGFTGTGGGAGSTDAGSSGGASPADARPEAGHECVKGEYSGTLSGPYSAALGDTTFTADLDFTVETTGSVAGTLRSTSDSTSRATLTGKVDCVTGETSISIVNGTYRNFLGTTQYVGTMTATFDSNTDSFREGKWEITEPNSPGSGSGSWSAQ
jgi:hypothetical protein